jgi:hypothetical protein
MYLYKKESERLLKKLRVEMVDELKGKFDFLLDLLHEDDWSFVIKSHALIEAATTEMIIHHLGEERLKGIVERLPLSDTQFGKIAVVKNLALLDDHQRKFVRWFSGLRNKLVHRIENVNFTFKDHLKQLDKNQKTSWKTSVTWFAQDNATREQWQTIAEKNPKVVLFMAVSQLVVACVLATQQVKGIRRIDHTANEATKALFKTFISARRK